MAFDTSTFGRYQPAGSSTIGSLVRSLLSGDGSSVGPLMDAIRDSGDDVRFRAFRGVVRRYVMDAHMGRFLLEKGPTVRRRERYVRRVENHLHVFRSAVVALFAFELFDANDMVVKLFDDARGVGIRFDPLPSDSTDFMDVGRPLPGEGGDMEGEPDGIDEYGDDEKADYDDDGDEGEGDEDLSVGGSGEIGGAIMEAYASAYAEAAMDHLDRVIGGDGSAPPLVGHDSSATLGVGVVVEGDRVFPPVTLTNSPVTLTNSPVRWSPLSNPLPPVVIPNNRIMVGPTDGFRDPPPIEAGDGLGRSLVDAVVSGMEERIASVGTEVPSDTVIGVPVVCRGVQVGRVVKVSTWSQSESGDLMADLVVDWDGVRRLMQVPGFKGDGS